MLLLLLLVVWGLGVCVWGGGLMNTLANLLKMCTENKKRNLNRANAE